VVAHGGRVCGSAPIGHASRCPACRDVLPTVADHQLVPATLTVDLGAPVLIYVPVHRPRVRHARIITHAYDNPPVTRAAVGLFA
jgi:hypothetical protein